RVGAVAAIKRRGRADGGCGRRVVAVARVDVKGLHINKRQVAGACQADTAAANGERIRPTGAEFRQRIGADPAIDGNLRTDQRVGLIQGDLVVARERVDQNLAAGRNGKWSEDLAVDDDVDDVCGAGADGNRVIARVGRGALVGR